MKFLADENFPRPAVVELRGAGFDAASRCANVLSARREDHAGLLCWCGEGGVGSAQADAVAQAAEDSEIAREVGMDRRPGRDAEGRVMFVVDDLLGGL